MAEGVVSPETRARGRVRVLHDRVVVEPFITQGERITRAGVIIPRTVKDDDHRRARRGRVREVGPGVLMKSGARYPMPNIRVGDVVLYKNVPGPTRVTVGGREVLVMNEELIIAVLEDDETSKATDENAVE